MSDDNTDLLCPKCGEECWRDSVDVGVGVIHGPWGCPGCGWSAATEYDCSGGKTSPAQAEDPEWYIDQWGRAIRKAAIKNKLKHFGLDPSVVDEVFGPEERKSE